MNGKAITIILAQHVVGAISKYFEKPSQASLPFPVPVLLPLSASSPAPVSVIFFNHLRLRSLFAALKKLYATLGQLAAAETASCSPRIVYSE